MNNKSGSFKFYFTLRFLWQTLTSSTSKDTEFCSFSEFWDGFSVCQKHKELSVIFFCPFGDTQQNIQVKDTMLLNLRSLLQSLI